MRAFFDRFVCAIGVFLKSLKLLVGEFDSLPFEGGSYLK